MKHIIYTIFINILVSNFYSQVDTAKIKILGYLDVFYGYDFNTPKEKRQNFLFNYNRHNETNINLGLIRVDVENKKIRTRIALQTGTYAQDNYIAEPIMYKPINEAYLGMSVNKKNNIWIDAGVFNSHLGFESSIGVENHTLSRSLTAENSPYFLSGVKLTHQIKNKWSYSIVLSNGWQRIKRVDGNSMPSVGTQLIYQPSDKVLLNWSTFVTTEDPDTNRREIYFNNIYSKIKINKKWNTILGFDYGLRQVAPKSVNKQYWLNATLIVQYLLNNRWSMAFRTEYFDDYNNIIINSQKEFNTFGISLNIDKKIHNMIVWRNEIRFLNSTKQNFETPNGLSNSNTTYLSSLSILF